MIPNKTIKPRYLVTDLGNTTSKLAVFQDNEILSIQTFSGLNRNDIELVLGHHTDISATILSSVINTPDWLIQMLRHHSSLHLFSSASRIPFENLYGTPQTLGLDRLACAAGCYKAFPGSDVLSIDAGTCIKYDFINSLGQYLGGAISPGIEMRLKAMNTFTARLPLVEPKGKLILTGRTTEECLRSGAVLGAIAEAENIISRYREKYTSLKVVLTGGDAKYFDNQLKSAIFARPNLLLEGLHEILVFNEV